MKTILIIFSAMFSVLFVKAQTIDVAKENDFFGDAKTAALAGSTGALGGSFAASFQNPAGLAFCLKNEFTLSPFIKVKRQASMMHKNASTDEKWEQSIGSLGLVYGLSNIGKNKTMMRRASKSQWSNLNLGVGFMRTADFNERLLAEGVNDKNSLLDAFLEVANFGEGVIPEKLDPMSTSLAFQTMLIDTMPRQFQYDSVNYFSIIPNGLEWQSLSREREGRARSLIFSFAGTYGKKLSLGLAIARSNLEFTEVVVYREADQKGDLIPYFNEFVYEKKTQTIGRGFGLKGGAIWEAAPWLLIGLSGQTPTFMNMVEVQNASMKSDISDRALSAEAPEEVAGYQMSTASKATLSTGLRNKAKTFAVNIDYEMVDYQSLKVRTPDVAFNLNREIATMLHPTANLRIGGEVILKKKVSLRAGVAAMGNSLVGNPFMQMKWNPDFAENISQNLAAFERTTVAAGFGLTDLFKSKKVGANKKGVEYYLDMSFAVTKFNNPPMWLYRLEAGDQPKVESTGIERRVLMTLGIRF